MMSVGRHLHSNGSTGDGHMNKAVKASRLLAVQADFQQRLLQEKEQRILAIIDEENTKKQQKIERYQERGNREANEKFTERGDRERKMDRYQDRGDRNDVLSAPGGVRQYFNERKNPGRLPQSAQPTSQTTQSSSVKRGSGYDKSRPLAPLKPENKTIASTKLVNKNEPSEFERWKAEQDALDKQRRLKGVNKGESLVPARITSEELEREREELDRMHKEQEREYKAMMREREEEKRQRQAELHQKTQKVDNKRKQLLQEQKRRHSLTNGGSANTDDSDDMQHAAQLKRLEAELQKKQRDLEDLVSHDAGDDDSDECRDNCKPPMRRSREDSSEPVFPLKPMKVVRTPKENRLPSSKDPDQIQQLERNPENLLVRTSKLGGGLYGHHSAHQKPLAEQKSPAHTQKARPHALNSTYNIHDSISDERIITSGYPAELDAEERSDADLSLVPCKLCGRRFAAERVSKHEEACRKAGKQRKQFNATHQRLAGSGAEEFLGKRRRNAKTPKAKKDWRAQHKEFIEAIRYAKKITQIEAQGGNASDLPPPPKSENPDYVQCPHCERRFNSTAAERHIPKCKDIKAKPAPLGRLKATKKVYN